MSKGINLNFSNTESPLTGSQWVNMSREKRVYLIKSAIDSFSSSADITVIDAPKDSYFFEKDYLLSQIKRFNGNITNVANFIGMERTALYRKIKSLNIDIDIKK